MSGASLSLFAIVVLCFLFIAEFNSYLHVSSRTDIVMDTSDEELLQINFNVTFPELNCHLASVDIEDAISVEHQNITGGIRKMRLDSRQRRLGLLSAKKVAAAAAKPTSAEELDPNAVRKVGARPATGQAFTNVESIKDQQGFDDFLKKNKAVAVNFFAPWCIWSKRLTPVWDNTATELSSKPWAFENGVQNVRLARVDCTVASAQSVCQSAHVNAFPTVQFYKDGKTHSHDQYHGERTTEMFLKWMQEQGHLEEHAEAKRAIASPSVAEEDKPDPAALKAPTRGAEGCRVSGSVMVKKVPGNFHISYHSLKHSFDHERINTSHVVHHFSFGKRLTPSEVAVLPQPEQQFLLEHTLDSRRYISEKTNVSHYHFIKVVSSAFKFLSYDDVVTFKYTANSNSYRDQKRMPVAKFTYDLSPMSVVVSQEKMPFYHFITQVCAIIGGVFTVIGLLDSTVHHASVAMSKKVALGKQG